MAAVYAQRSLAKPVAHWLVFIVCMLIWGAPAWAQSIELKEAWRKTDEVTPTDLLPSSEKYEEAELWARRALDLAKKELEAESSAFLHSVDQLAEILGLRAASEYEGPYQPLRQKHLLEAEELFKLSLSIRKKNTSYKSQDIAESQRKLAQVYVGQGRITDAELMHRESIELLEKTLGKNHPDVGEAVYKLAEFYNLRNFKKAEPLYRRVISINEKSFGRESPEIADIFFKYGVALIFHKREPEAIPFLKRSISIFIKKPTEYFSKANDVGYWAIFSVSSLYNNSGRYSDSAALWQQVLTAIEKIPNFDTQITAKIIKHLASDYYKLRRYAEAEPLYLRAVSLDPNDWECCWAYQLAYLYEDQQRFDDAEALLTRFEPHAPPGAAPLTEFYVRRGRYFEAERIYQERLAQAESRLSGDDISLIEPISSLANLDRLQGKNTEAETLYRRALIISEKYLNAGETSLDSGTKPSDIARILTNLGSLYTQQFRYADAEASFKRALTILEKTTDLNRAQIAENLNHLAELNVLQDRTVDAVPIYTRSISIQDKMGTDGEYGVASTLIDLGNIYMQLGRFADASGMYKRAHETLSKMKGDRDPDVAASMFSLANAYSYMGRYKEAERLLQQALAKAEGFQNPNQYSLAAILKRLADNYLLMKMPIKSEQFYRRALEIYEKNPTPSKINIADTYLGLGYLYRFQGRYSEMVSLMQRVITMTDTESSFSRKINNQAKAILAEGYGALGNYEKAAPLLEGVVASDLFKNVDYFSLIENATKAGYFTEKKSFDLAFSLLQSRTSSKAGDAFSKFSQRFIVNKGHINELVREEQDLSGQFDIIEKLLIEEISRKTESRQSAELQLRSRLLDVENRRKKLRDNILEIAPNYVALTNPPAIKAEDIQPILAEDEALLAIMPGPKSYIWLLTNTTSDWAEIPVSAAGLSSQVQALRASLSSGKFNLRLGYTMYRQLFSPIIDKLAGKKRLSVYVNGPLSSIPLQVLVTKDPAGKGYREVDWLVKSYAVTNVPSIFSFKSQRTTVPPSRAPKTMIAFGDPVYDQNLAQKGKQAPVINIAQRGITSFYRGELADFSLIGRSLAREPLPGTRREVLAVAKSVNASARDLYLGLSASPATVRNANLTDYRIVYFATHALVAGDIEKFIKAKAEPAIALTFPKNPTRKNNGLLFASDVAQLKMDADWTVLSACNTAAGDSVGAEALSGLARAFIYAGSRSLLVSHWQVDDRRTARLMTNLFGIVQANPTLSHGEALQQAELRLLGSARSDEDANPRLWAPFVVIGEPAKNKPTARK